MLMALLRPWRGECCVRALGGSTPPSSPWIVDRGTATVAAMVKRSTSGWCLVGGLMAGVFVGNKEAPEDVSN